MHTAPELDWARRFGPPESQSEPHGLTVLLAIALLMLVGALVIWQVTVPPTAERFVRAALAATVDPRGYVTDRGNELRALASQGPVVQPPGYAVTVYLSASEVSQASDEQLADLLLRRTADAVLLHGAAAFDAEGAASFSRFSRAGLLAWFIDVLRSETLHFWASLGAIGWSFVVAALGAMVVAKSQPHHRLRLLGWAAVAGSLPGVIFFGAVAFWLNRNGGDPFTRTLAAVAADAFEMGRNDYLIVLVGGALLVAGGRLLSWLSSRTQSPPSETYGFGTTEWRGVAELEGDREALNEP